MYIMSLVYPTYIIIIINKIVCLFQTPESIILFLKAYNARLNATLTVTNFLNYYNMRNLSVY